MKKFLSSVLIIALVFSLTTVCFAAESNSLTTEEAEWTQMMDLAKETFPELKADMEEAMAQPQVATSALAKGVATGSDQVIFREVRATKDGGILSVTKFESGTYGFVYSAKWLTNSGEGSARTASFQVWYMQIQAVVSVHSLKFVYTPGGNDYFTDTGYAVSGYSLVQPVATKRSEDSSGPAYSLFEVQWSAEILGQPIFETMGIRIEVGGDSVSVYVNGELAL